jgi:hypothetical protein
VNHHRASSLRRKATHTLHTVLTCSPIDFKIYQNFTSVVIVTVMSRVQLLADLRIIRCTVHDALDALAQAADSDESAPLDVAAALAARKARLDPVLDRFVAGYCAMRGGTPIVWSTPVAVAFSNWSGFTASRGSCGFSFDDSRGHRCTCDHIHANRSTEPGNG